MEVDGAQEWPEWAMQAGEAEQRRVDRAGPRSGEWHVPAEAQGEAGWDLEETKERPQSCHQSCLSLRGLGLARTSARGDGRWGRRQGILGKWGSVSSPKEEVR